MEKTFTIIDEAGLHARPASILVQKASKYPNPSFIEYQGKKLTLKSIMAVMSLGVSQNANITISVDGDDAQIVMGELEKVLVDNQLV